jgi:hypothetical protein
MTSFFVARIAALKRSEQGPCQTINDLIFFELLKFDATPGGPSRTTIAGIFVPSRNTSVVPA